jgi:hypothetical protein
MASQAHDNHERGKLNFYDSSVRSIRLNKKYRNIFYAFIHGFLDSTPLQLGLQQPWMGLTGYFSIFLFEIFLLFYTRVILFIYIRSRYSSLQ